MKEIFKNKHRMLESFGYEFLVKCPKCNKSAKVIPTDKSMADSIYAKRRFICSSCGTIKDMKPLKRTYDNHIMISYSSNWKEGYLTIGGPFDWYFGLELFLQMPCCGKLLWAYNLEHLNYIEEYVSAEIRENMPYYLSVESRLPKWIKSSKNRKEILNCIYKLKVK